MEGLREIQEGILAEEKEEEVLVKSLDLLGLGFDGGIERREAMANNHRKPANGLTNLNGHRPLSSNKLINK